MNSNALKELNNSFRSNKNTEIKFDIISPQRNYNKKNNLQNLSCQNTENILISENNYTKYLTNKNYTNKLSHSLSSKISVTSKSYRLNNNIYKPNLDLSQKNKYCINNIAMKNNKNKIPTNNNKNLYEKNNNLINSQKKNFKFKQKNKKGKISKKKLHRYS